MLPGYLSGNRRLISVVVFGFLSAASSTSAGPFILQSGSQTDSQSSYTLHDPSFSDPNPTTITDNVQDFGADVSSRSTSVGPATWGGASGAASSQVTASFSDVLISVLGSATSTASASGFNVDSNNPGYFAGLIKFKVDTAGQYRVYGSFHTEAAGGTNPTAFANLTLSSFNANVTSMIGNSPNDLSFDEIVSLNTFDTYEFSYSASAQAISLNGAGFSSSSMTFAAYLEQVPAAVPEPSSLALVGGAAAVGGYVRRRRTARQTACRG